MLIIWIFVISITTALIPQLIKRINVRFPKARIRKSQNWLPILAAFLFFIAWFVPNVHISKETTTFQQHFIGGGMYSALLYVYVKRLFGWNLSLVTTLIVLFGWVSAFGVANELLEFTATKLHLASIGTGDTDWDLLANTLGAFTGYILLLVTKIENVNRSE